MSETSNPTQAGDGSVPSGCPVAGWFKPTDTAAHTDPFEWYDRVRQEARVFYAPGEGGEDGFFVVSHHEDVLEVLRDRVSYSNGDGLGEFGTAPPEILAEAGQDWHFPMQYTLTLTDPPQHTRLRKLMQPSFTPRRLSAFEDKIREIVNGRLDVIADRGHADLARDFAYEIPNRVIAQIIGADEAAAEHFVEWVEAFLAIALAGDSDGDRLQDWRLLREQEHYCRALVEARRQKPENDLTTDMIHAKTDDGESVLTDDEILSNTLGFIGAGSESTAVAISTTMLLLLSHPEQWEAVKADPDLIPIAFEEGLRRLGPVRGLIRTAVVDTEIAGVPIPKGARVYLAVMSANHDPAAFDQPEAFNIHRPDLSKHLGFGKWQHFCIGAPLARLEGRIAIEALVERLPSLRLAPDHGFSFGNNLSITPVRALRVEWEQTD